MSSGVDGLTSLFFVVVKKMTKRVVLDFELLDFSSLAPVWQSTSEGQMHGWKDENTIVVMELISGRHHTLRS